MRCMSPLSIPRPNGGGAFDRITVPCGRCVNCLSNRQKMWAFRLEEELKTADNAYFVTLTYADEHLPADGNVNIGDVQKFIKRLRKSFSDSEKNDLELIKATLPEKPKVSQIASKGPKNRFRYFIVSEYGPENNRPHYHGIFFNVPCVYETIGNDFINEKLITRILNSWQNGFVHVGTVTPASIMYCAKYCITKSETPEGKISPFLVCRLALAKAISMLISDDITIKPWILRPPLMGVQRSIYPDTTRTKFFVRSKNKLMPSQFAT